MICVNYVPHYDLTGNMAFIWGNHPKMAASFRSVNKKIMCTDKMGKSTVDGPAKSEAPVDGWAKSHFYSKVPTIRLVVQDFAGPSTV